MQKIPRSTLSDRHGVLTLDGALQLSCPKSWKEMSQEQLRYTLFLIGSGRYAPEELRTLLLIRLTGIDVIRKGSGGWACSVRVCIEGGNRVKRHFFFLQTWQVYDMIRQLEYVDSYETMDVRLESIQGFKAVDVLLHRVMFKDYLNMEKYYQGYLATKENHYALGLARLLYPGGVTAIDASELVNCVMWFSYVKSQFAKFFPRFFKPAPRDGKSVSWKEQMDAMIRSLTEGDITKEETVLNADTWRALTELDAKAHDAQEFKRKFPKG